MQPVKHTVPSSPCHGSLGVLSSVFCLVSRIRRPSELGTDGLKPQSTKPRATADKPRSLCVNHWGGGKYHANHVVNVDASGVTSESPLLFLRLCTGLSRLVGRSWTTNAAAVRTEAVSAQSARSN